MDLRASGRGPINSSQNLFALPEYIINNFFPGTLARFASHPRIAKVLSVLLALWWTLPYAYSKLETIFSNVWSLCVSTISVHADEGDLFEYLAQWLAKQKTISAVQALMASSKGGQENRIGHQQRHYYGEDYSHRPEKGESKVEYEQAHGQQVFFFRSRLFLLDRGWGEGSIFNGRRHHRAETFTLSCLGRSTAPIKQLVEHVHATIKEKEQALTVIRRPLINPYQDKNAWSRVTAKSRRPMETVILEGEQKAEIIADIDDYLSASTRTWYADRGIPYRRGYLFHGPPGMSPILIFHFSSRFSIEARISTSFDG